MKPIKISEVKKKTVNELEKCFIENKTIMITSIMEIPSSQLQKIKQSLKGKALIRISKNNIIRHAFEKVSKAKQNINLLEPQLKEGIALVMSNLDAFELSGILADSQKPAKAKAGQIAKEDILVHSGPTDLAAGPVLTELSKVHIKANIEGGKINIKETATLTKAGEIITKDVANVLSRLEIMPLKIGIIPLSAYDSDTQKVYENIKIDKEKTLEDLKILTQQAFNLSIKTAFYCKENISLLISKATMEFSALQTHIKEEKAEETIKEENKSSSESEIKSEENKN